MDKLLEHIYKRFEYTYYTQNPDIDISNYINNNSNYNCLKNEGLDCNCIPGIILHYMGYIYSSYLSIPSIKTFFKITGNIAFIQLTCHDMPLIPILYNEPAQKYYWENYICKECHTLSKQIYVPFRKYQNLNDLYKEIQQLQIMKSITYGNILNGYNVKFWELFLMAMRIQKTETCSRAFLSMSVFLAPFRTLQHINAALKNGYISGTKNFIELANFLYDYLVFISSLKDSETGLFCYITQGFQKLTSIDLSFFIENIISNDKVPISEKNLKKLFLTAYDNNMQALTRRKGEFKILWKKLKESDLPQDIVHNINNYIKPFR